MPRPRLPDAVASVTGALVKNPQRARATVKARPLGPAPRRLSAVERKAWRELADELPWLSHEDRTLVEVTAKLKARLMSDPEMGVNALAQLRMCLSAMGATPADRSRISARPDEDDGDDEFLN